jgi:uncharacterized membrane protein YdjX (TVP38/TMEM64 family)
MVSVEKYRVPASQIGETTVTHPGILGTKLLAISLVILAILIGSWTFRDSMSLANLAHQESMLREFQTQNQFLFYGLAFLCYAIFVSLPVPGAGVLTMIYGWYFGLIPAVILVSLASTTGATIAFLLSRSLFLDLIRLRFAHKLAKYHQAIESEAPYLLFCLRLVPVMPFFIVNVMMALTPIRPTTFWWISQLGMLPGTSVYAFVGSKAPNLQTLTENGLTGVFTQGQITQILIAFLLLGLFPSIVHWAMKAIACPIRIPPDRFAGKSGSKENHQP